MPQTEITTIPVVSQEASNDAVFSNVTRIQALKIISDEHGWLVRAFSGPVINIFDWIINRKPNIDSASSVVEARKKFNSAANDVAHWIPSDEETKKAA